MASVTGETTAVARLVITPEQASVAVGATTKLTATAYSASGSALEGIAVEWMSLNPAIATVSAGTVTGRARGTAKIRAAGGGRSDTVAVAVGTTEEPKTIASVSVQPRTASVRVGESTQLVAVAQDPYGNTVPNQTPVWSSSNTAVASVSATGVVKGVSTGSATITARIGEKSGVAAVTVSAAALPVAAISIAPASAGVAVGGTLQLTATARDANGNALSGYSFAWSSMNAEIASVSATGAVKGLRIGSVTVTASAGGKVGSASVTVTQSAPPPATVARLVVSPDPVTFNALGSSRNLTATAYDSNGSVAAGAAVSWKTSNAGIVTVDSLGKVTARGVGSALIVATALCCSSVADPVTAVVTQLVASVAVTPHSTSVQAGSTGTLQAAAYDSNSNVVPGATIAWSSSNAQVATVSNGTVTGVGAGTVVIRAASGNFSDSSVVTVTTTAPPPPVTPVLTDIIVTPASTSLDVGNTQQFTAVAKDQNGNTMSGVAFSWTSSNTNVMTVSNGLVRAVAVGAAVLRVSSGTVRDSAAVTVTQAPPPGSYATPDIAFTNFDAGNSAPFTTASGGTTGNTDIVIMNDPTGQFSGKVAQIRFLRGSTTASADVNRALRYAASPGVGYGQTIYTRGHVLIPTPAANMANAQRKLFYFQRTRNDGDAFLFLKAEGSPSPGKQELKVELPKCPTNNQVLSAGEISFDRKTSIEIQMTVNSAPGANDATLRVWVDGVMTLNRQDVCTMRAGTAPYTVFLYGQQTQHIFSDLSITFSEYRYWDNLAISTKRIGP